jgi:hypothetical protein
VTDGLSDSPILHYFVDESGSGVIFNARGKVILGTEGCSNYFFLGAMACENPEGIEIGLKNIWRETVNDPYMISVQSIDKRRNAACACFHATDDPPEVRREVFKFLLDCDIKFFAVVKDMRVVLDYVHSRNQVDPGYRYRPNELYDFTVRLLFPDKLHSRDNYFVHFAKRGKSDRTAAIVQALETARKRFGHKKKIKITSDVDVRVKSSHNSSGLQVADYWLWALQRFYEMNDDRYLSYIWSKVSLVLDVDDKRQKPYGSYYSQKNPLTLAKIRNRRI